MEESVVVFPTAASASPFQDGSPKSAMSMGVDSPLLLFAERADISGEAVLGLLPSHVAHCPQPRREAP